MCNVYQHTRPTYSWRHEEIASNIYTNVLHLEIHLSKPIEGLKYLLVIKNASCSKHLQKLFLCHFRGFYHNFFPFLLPIIRKHLEFWGD